MREELIERGVRALEADLPIIVTEEWLAYDIYHAYVSRHGYVAMQVVSAWEVARPRVHHYAVEGVGTAKQTYTRLQPTGGVLLVKYVDALSPSDQPILIQLVEKNKLAMLGIHVPKGTKIILHASDLERVHEALLNKVIYVGEERLPIADVVRRRVV